MSAARQLLKRAMASVLPRQRLLLQGPEANATAHGQHSCVDIALTFDDGPHPEWTPAVLDALASAGWKGTFFVIGQRAVESPELVHRIVAEGHAIGNHTFTHSNPRMTSAAQFNDEVTRTDALIAELTGTHPTLMRPPMGHLTPGKFRALWRKRQSIVLWNVDPEDFAMTANDAGKRWSDAYAPQQGDVVLLHDRLPYAAEIVRALTTRHGEGLRSVSITEWLPGAQPDEHNSRGRGSST